VTDYDRVTHLVRQRITYSVVAAVTFGAMFLAITDHGRWFVTGVLALLGIFWVFGVGELSRDIQIARQKSDDAFRARTQTQRD
jgi:hypothetical protein